MLRGILLLFLCLLGGDILAEGLNLQDCCRLINYDIHWNPVRLMQRIGRIDRVVLATDADASKKIN